MPMTITVYCWKRIPNGKEIAHHMRQTSWTYIADALIDSNFVQVYNINMSFSNYDKETECVISWFNNWSVMQKGDFMCELVERAVPTNVDSLFDAMHALNVSSDKPPSIFHCQIKLFSQWFDSWTDKQRNDFMLKLHCTDPDFVTKFNEEVELLKVQQS